MAESLSIAFGPLSVRIDVDAQLTGVLRALEAWFPGDRDAATSPDLVFELRPPGSRLGAGPVRVGAGTVSGSTVTAWDGRAWQMEVDTAAGGSQSRVRLTQRDGRMLRTIGRLPGPLFRFLHVHRFSKDEVRASTFLYRHLIPWVQAGLVRRDATLVHAAAVRRVGEGGGMLVAGWGGAGKTSGTAALYYGTPDRWAFLSDDLAILDSAARLHRSPIPLNVFPYSTARFPPLHDRVVAPMGPWDRLQWIVRGRIMGRDGVARRVPAPAASGTGAPEPLRLAVQLERGGVREPRTRPCEPATFAQSCRTVLRYELRQGIPMYTAAGALAASPDAVPAVDRLVARAEQIVASALDATPCVELAVPDSTSVARLGALLESAWSDRVTR